MSEYVNEGYQGSTYDSVEEAQQFMATLGFTVCGVMVWPEKPAKLAETVDGLVWVEMPHPTPEAARLAKQAEEDLAGLYSHYGLGNVILLTAPKDPELEESKYGSPAHKLVFIHLPEDAD